MGTNQFFVLLGSAIGPLMYGAAFDIFGHFRFALYASGIVTTCTMVPIYLLLHPPHRSIPARSSCMQASWTRRLH